MKGLIKNIVASVLAYEARLLLRRHSPTIVMVTGSVGKTSTKDAIYTVLKGSIRARKNQRSMNSDLGVPLTILGLQNAWNSPFGWLKNLAEGLYIAMFLREYPEVLVLEAGVDQPGDMKRLTAWLKPDVVVLTRLPDVPTHVEHFNSPAEVIEEKLELVRALKADGVLIYNNDDEKIRQAVTEVRQSAFGYSRYSVSHFHVSGDVTVYDGSAPAGLTYTLSHLDQEYSGSVMGSLGVQHTYNCAAAAAVGYHFGVPVDQAVEALKDYVPPAGRMRLVPGINHTQIIDDTYNSSPVACERALLTLGELTGNHRKIAVLGDMLELGHFSVREHERVGERVVEVADFLITIGVRSRKIASGALEHGMSEKFILQYDDPIKAAEELRTMIKKDDIILVKASQNVRAEKIVERIMAEPQKAGELLTRQDLHWKNR